MHFARLRLSGFKSFVDPTEVAIEPGLTGIVGPNGCGKSNLVEALRWAMGENSARRMRGQEMDDVIFGGTSGRAARSVAEVQITLDNSDRTAPGLHEVDTIEVVRRIERGMGSDFRINGRSVRARDVQLLFQDNASGPASPALVSQGRVAALIAARPSERRLILEEAAGTTGLHSRRHEAELRLRSAEENLSRLDETIAQLSTQLSSLRRQARQAARYRELSDRIRVAEATLLHLRWTAALAALAAARERHRENERVVGDRMVAVGRAATEQAEAAAVLPPLRRDDQEAAAALQRLLVERDGIEAEEKRLAADTAETRRLLDQAERDVARERALAVDAAQALERLREERERIEGQAAGEGAAEAEAMAAIAARREAVEALDREATRLTEETAAAEARRQALARQAAEIETRVNGLRSRLAEAERRHAAAAAVPAGPSVEALAAAEVEAVRQLDAARTALEAAEAAVQAAAGEAAGAREAFQTADAAATRLKAEADGLRAALAGGRDARRGGQSTLVDAVSVEPGSERAFGAALGEDASIPIAAEGPLRWADLGPPAEPLPLPEGAAPLALRVSAPAALARRLAATGIVEDPARAEALQPSLRPGQVLVTPDGGAWRWDGVIVAPGAPSPAAARLAQRNRLAALEADLEIASRQAAETRSAFEAARAAATAAQERERAARQAQQAAFTALARAREAHAKAARADVERRARIEAAEAERARLAEALAEAENELAARREEAAALPPLDGRREALSRTRAAVAEARTALNHAQSRLERLQREAQGRRNRLRAIESETTGWEARARGSTDRLAELEARVATTRSSLQALLEKPASLDARRTALLDAIAAAETRRRQCGDALARAEERQVAADRELRQAEAALAEARETRVRAEAEVQAAIQARDTIAARIAERLDAPPEEARRIAGLLPDAALPDAGEIEAALERLVRDRDAIGPVNLRAEAEMAEVDERIATLIREKDDLTAAIGKLRQGIAALNREARERLSASFGQVDGHFRTLFTRLFGGGRAHLELTDTDDPLEAGLEIYASPPGKKLQHLSLLSGGEQALTALSLIFAVFLTNPAPICVLDEVDAPLDDANVDRLCNLLTELAGSGRTRFLIITHHRMTMARVDRLYGVTMVERGVSQLVSVDLEQATLHARPHQPELAL